MSRSAALALTLALVAGPAAADTVRLVAPDGSVHYTNIPDDPRYRRLGLAPELRPREAARPSDPGPALAPAGLPYGSEIRRAALRYGLPEPLIAAVIRVESGFNPRAVSRKGALGLMQLMPETAESLGVRNPFDPRENIDGGVRHLRALLERFANDLPLALAAYNAGEQAVLAYRGIPPFPETREYVTRILRLLGGLAAGGRAWVGPPTFRRVEPDGTVVYTNIPPMGRL